MQPLNVLRHARRALFAAALASGASGALAASTPPEKITPDQLDFFERKIRPVLVAKCYSCHSAQAEKVKGGLLLDTREGIRHGGENGHAVEPRNLKESLLIRAIRSDDKEHQMPPKEKLPPSVIADFEKWVLMGAPDPRDGSSTGPKKPDLAAAKNFWSFQPLAKVSAPTVRDTAWPAGDIDRFVLAALEAKGLRPVADADRATLLRRVSYDLVGLPPSPEQIRAFLDDSSSRAFEKVVDELLASPQFGERWGRHWLDVARYAESTGKERNYTYTQAWRYRDYVIASLNADKPYDRFIREQVAGDLLPAKSAAERNDLTVATGFLALGPKGLNERNREQFVMDNIDEQIDVTTRAVMAVTVSCARCHDHKFDPIATRDYYAMAGIFKSTDIFYGTGGNDGGAGKNRQPGKLLPLAKDDSFKPAAVSATTAPPAAEPAALKPGDDAKLAKLAARNPKLVKKLETMSPEQKAKVLARLQENPTPAKPAKNPKQKKAKGGDASPGESDSAGGGERVLMGVRDSRNIADCPIYVRGELQEKGPVIPRGFVTALNLNRPSPALPSGQSGRLELAAWLTAPENPLTARVAANRVWQHLFGEGIVRSADNFGATGDRPTHPELLDHLAQRFIAGGWSMKKLIREIVLSHAYRLGSFQNEKNFAADPDNTLLWHASQRRLDAEAIRDGILAASGQLDLKPPQGSPVTALGDVDIGRGGRGVVRSATRNRSVYLPIIRDMVPEALDLFDFAEPSLVVATREVTTVPSQALFMLNSQFVFDQSTALAATLAKESDSARRIDLAYLRTLSRPPSAAERERAGQFLGKIREENRLAPEAALTTFCQALIASAEFRYVR